MMETVLGGVPVLAAVLTGLFAGLFLAFSMAVMPGLARTGDRTMVESMRGINTAILNPLFALVFVGAPVAVLGSVALYSASGARVSAAWAGAGLVLLVVTVVVTFTVNVPRNNALERSAAVPNQDPAAVRADFEPVWVRWNHLRSLVSVTALVCSVMALVTG
ncbi:anthrone oxygenase family protein [Nocardiopsis terrae]